MKADQRISKKHPLKLNLTCNKDPKSPNKPHLTGGEKKKPTIIKILTWLYYLTRKKTSLNLFCCGKVGWLNDLLSPCFCVQETHIQWAADPWIVVRHNSQTFSQSFPPHRPKECHLPEKTKLDFGMDRVEMKPWTPSCKFTSPTD